MRKRWRLHPFDAGRIAQLEQAAGIPSIVAQLLLGRGVYEPAAAKLFLEAKLTGLREPELLPGVTDAAERVHAAITARKKIAIYGDYDADGMTGTAILLGCLKLLGADCKYYVPNRLEEGYGLNHEALRTLAEYVGSDRAELGNAGDAAGEGTVADDVRHDARGPRDKA